MPFSKEDENVINEALQSWRQGDISLDSGLEFLHLADLTCPHSPASLQIAEAMTVRSEIPEANLVAVMSEVRGVVMLSQTCDVIRDCGKRPFVNVAPLIEVPRLEFEAIRRLKRPARAYIPATEGDRLVADLDRTMTIEKSIVARWTRIPGWKADNELRDFVSALTRKWTRFAFPEDFVVSTKDIQRRLANKHDKRSKEGAHLRALREIRVRGAPSWDNEIVHLSWWFIKDADPLGVEADWPKYLKLWIDLFNDSDRFELNTSIVCRLEEMTARDYLESDRLDLDRVTTGSRRA